MSRKKRYVQKMTSKDEEMLRAFSNVGHLTKEMLKMNFAIADRRISSYEKDGYLEKVSYLDKSTKDVYFIYRLSNKGKKLCKKHLETNYFYRSSSPTHDIEVAKQYLSLSTENRSNWVTESEWRNRFLEHLKDLEGTEDWWNLKQEYDSGSFSPPDGGFIDSEGGCVAIEIVTSSYTITDIQKKIDFCMELQIEYNQIKV